MSDNNDEFKDAKNCKEIIQHLHPINIDELKKYFNERKITEEPGIYTEIRGQYTESLHLPEFKEKQVEGCNLNLPFTDINIDDGKHQDLYNEDSGDFHVEFSELYKFANPLTYLIVKNNSLKTSNEKKYLKDAIELLVENGADINYFLNIQQDVSIVFKNTPFENDLNFDEDSIIYLAMQVENKVAIEKLLEYDELVIIKPFVIRPPYRHLSILRKIALLDNVDLFVQLIQKIEKTETIGIVDYTLNQFVDIRTMKINLQSPEIREELKIVLRVLIRALKKMNNNSIPQKEQKELLKYVGDDEELKTFLINNHVMNKDIATYAKKLRRENTIKKALSEKISDDKIVKSIMDEWGGKTKKRKNKKSKSHKNKTKGKKNKSKSKKKTSLNNYDIYRMPY